MLSCCIILDARESGAGLASQLTALRPLIDQPDELIEILLVDDAADSRLPGMAHRSLARLLHCDKTPLGDRLNIAVSRGQGETLLFPAPRLTPSVDWFSRATEAIQREEADCVVLARLATTPLKSVLQRLRQDSPSSTLFLSRRWFERIGGCDPSLDRNTLPDLLDRLRACQARVANINN